MARWNGSNTHYAIGLAIKSWEMDSLKRLAMIIPYSDGAYSYCNAKILWQPADDWAILKTYVPSDDIVFNSLMVDHYSEVPDEIHQAIARVADSGVYENKDDAKKIYRYFKDSIADKESMAKLIKSQIKTNDTLDEFNAQQSYGVVRNAKIK